MASHISQATENKSILIGVAPLNTELVYFEENSKKIGSLLVVYTEDTAFFYSVEILKDYRRKGYGRLMVNNALIRCKNKGFKRVSLQTEESNDVAIHLYETYGFERVGEIEDGYINWTLNLDEIEVV